MMKKRVARLEYYEGLKEALVVHLQTTERGLRKLPKLSENKIDELLADVRKRHKVLMKRLDKQMAQEGIEA